MPSFTITPFAAHDSYSHTRFKTNHETYSLVCIYSRCLSSQEVHRNRFARVIDSIELLIQRSTLATHVILYYWLYYSPYYYSHLRFGRWNHCKTFKLLWHSSFSERKFATNLRLLQSVHSIHSTHTPLNIKSPKHSAYFIYAPSFSRFCIPASLKLILFLL